MSVNEAFFDVCREAQPAGSFYVSLYVRAPYYGGPEEGGWWGSDTHLIASQHYVTQEAAEAAKDAVEALADDLRAEAQAGHGERCLREMELLDARGLDADFLPEVDGADDYFVLIEERPGACERTGCRHYE